jgi:beta-lactamase regulating signal transducer with metallopeptidase domain
MNKISRSEKLKGMTRIEKDAEAMVSMQEMITLYQKHIQVKLDELTDNPVLQGQVKDVLGLD